MPEGDRGALLRTPSWPVFQREAWASRRPRHLEEVRAGRRGALQVPRTPASALRTLPLQEFRRVSSGPRPRGTNSSGGAG